MLSADAIEAVRASAFEAVGRVVGPVAWPQVPVLWNRRMRRAGRATLEGRPGRVVGATIELSPVYFSVYPEDLPGILVHEAVHVALGVLGLPTGHGSPFRRACLGANGLLHSRHMPGRILRYRCPVCGDVLERRRRPSGDRWCAPCAAAATREGLPWSVPERALVLVGIDWRGPERASAAPACDGVVIAASG